MAGRINVNLGDVAGGLRNLFSRETDAERYAGNPYYKPQEEAPKAERVERKTLGDRLGNLFGRDKDAPVAEVSPAEKEQPRERSFIGRDTATTLDADLALQHNGKTDKDETARLNRAAETLESFGIAAAAGLKDKTLTAAQGERLHEAVKEAGDFRYMSSGEKDRLNDTIAEITGAKKPTPVESVGKEAEGKEKDDSRNFIGPRTAKALSEDLAITHNGKVDANEKEALNRAAATLQEYGINTDGLKDKTLTTDQGKKLHDAVKAVADWGRISDAEKDQLNDAVSGITATQAGAKSQEAARGEGR